jgi:hypothetical protein
LTLSKPTVAVSRIVLVVLLVLVVALPIGVYWTIERIETHSRWERQLQEAQFFALYHMETASALVQSPGSSNQTVLDWGRNEMTYATGTLDSLSNLDQSHATQLTKIFNILAHLGTSWPGYVLGLSSTQKTTLSSLLTGIGSKVLNSYANYLNYTSSDAVSGPAFWYSGPTPPDETLLQEAVDLAVNWQGLPPLPV